jgi:high affinity Mn2+ porin
LRQSLAGLSWGQYIGDCALNAGGLGILVGDGQLSRPAAEQIVKVYYSLPVASWRLTVDFQYVGNPAYTMERGPISVIGTRLRKQFCLRSPDMFPK